MKYYYSLEDLSNRTIDIINVFVLPFINLYSLICTIISIIIFYNLKSRQTIHRLMLIESIAGIFYCLLNAFICLFRCGVFCSHGYSYGAKFYEIYIYIYIGKTIELFILLIDLNLSIIKYRSFSVNTRSSKKKSRMYFTVLVTAFLILSFLLNISPVILERSIHQVGYLAANVTVYNETVTIIERSLYVVTKSDLSSDLFYIYSIQLITILIGPFLLIVLVIVNLMVSFKLKKFIQNKTIQNNSNRNKNFIFSLNQIISFYLINIFLNQD